MSESFRTEHRATVTFRCEGHGCHRDILPGERYQLWTAPPWFEFNPNPGHWSHLRLHLGCHT